MILLAPPQDLRTESSNTADITAIAIKCTDRPNCWQFRRNKTCDRHHLHHCTRKQHQNTCQTCGRNNSFTDTEGGVKLSLCLTKHYNINWHWRSAARGRCEWQDVYRSTIPRSAHTAYLCVLCGSQNKQRLFPYTALTDWFYNRDGVFTARYGMGLAT